MQDTIGFRSFTAGGKLLQVGSSLLFSFDRVGVLSAKCFGLSTFEIGS